MRVLVHAEVELAAIDGSTSWLISVSRCLALAGAQVDVLARNVPKRAIVLDELRTQSGVHVAYPNAEAMNSPEVVAATIIARHRESPYDMVLIRGERTARILVGSPAVRGVLWYYMVGLPSVDAAPFARALAVPREIARGARGVMAQTPWLRDYLHAVVPEAIGKTEVLPPMVPDSFFRVTPRGSSRALRLGYAGKFDRPWHTLEIPALVSTLRERGIVAELTMHGDKVQAAKGDPQWHIRMRKLMADPPAGVHFPGALRRSDVPNFMAGCDLGIGWRDRALDTSYEISTKLLEFSAAGVPVVCNDTAIHRSIFGAEYPLYVQDDIGDVTAVIDRFVRSGESLHDWSRHVSRAVVRFGFAATAERLRELLDRISATASVAPPSTHERAYIHATRYPSGAFIEALGSATAMEVRSTSRSKTADWAQWLHNAELVFVDFTREALETLPEGSDAPVIALAAQGDDARGLANAHRAARIDALVSPDPELLSRIERVAPWCRTLLLDPGLLEPLLDAEAGEPASRHVTIAIDQGDLLATEQLADALRAAIDAARGLARVRVVVREGWQWDHTPRDENEHQFVRDFQRAVAGGALEDMEILTVSRHDSRWIRDASLLIPLGVAAADASVARLCASWGGSIHSRVRSRPLAGETHLHIGSLTSSAVAAALKRRDDAPEPAVGSARYELLQFVETVRKRHDATTG